MVGMDVRKGSEWWNDQVRDAVTEKKGAFEEWLEKRDRKSYNRNRQLENKENGEGSEMGCE